MHKVQQYLKKNEPRFINQLAEYIRFPSVSAQPRHKKDLEACARWLWRHCREIGLQAKLWPTAGHPILTARTPNLRPGRRPHFLVYGHYDVQPPEPFDLWNSPPFEPRIRGRAIFGRGASDNKGQHLAHLNAIEAYLKTGADLPCDITFLIEGEEEVGSDSLAGFVREHRRQLRCQALVISDTGIPSLKQPALTYALRGIVSFTVKLHGPSRDLHSGIFGGSVDNPAMALCQMLGGLRDRQGRIAIPGFYDEVVPLTRYERDAMSRLSFDKRAYTKFLGVRRLFGEAGFSPMEQRTARPTFEINGLTSGYQGEGSKTIIPAWAAAKITLRLVPNQEPEAMRERVFHHLLSHCPPTARLELIPGHGAEPYFVSPKSAKSQAALRALRMAFGHDPVLLREGGSIPIVNDFVKLMGAEVLMLGLALPDDNAHSPNEKFNLDCYAKGMLLSAYLWPELARASRA